MHLTLYQVDAFTEEPFRGNPAAVCVLPSPREAYWMQDVAREMNLSETAFLVPVADGYHLRWFTPTREVDLCGHATLAAAHVLWETGLLDPSEAARFSTQSGTLSARRRGGRIEMDFPAEPPREAPLSDALRGALGLAGDPVFAGHNRMDAFVVLPSEAAVRALTPEMTRLGAIDVRGVIATAPADDDGIDFVSRFFAPACGVPEDPVTGSAHCCLGPYWQQRLGKDDLVGYQASPRGGTVYVAPRGDRVLLAGHAVTVLKAEMVAGA
ncbi:MAG: PhzF family phenazine biosynthesis protein [Rhodothermales bacterium]|nr:PhzF family phenazine biosynthesis protein [Rhodothermales bacterium]